MLAALNHPNIAAIHGLEESGGVHFLVLEYVPGPTLAEMIAAGPIEVGSTAQIGVELSLALENAHEKNILHRDLKPANIKVNPEGKVKVLDFGLAKPFQPDPSADPAQAPTISVEKTREGTILGTAAYMSPEQARARPLDKRSDIWSFGCVLYEMLARKRAFAGETITDCLSAVLSREPDWDALPAETPPHLRGLLRRCLQKDPQKRLRDIGDARLELEEPTLATVAPSPSRGWRPVAAGAAFAAAGAVLALGVTWLLWGRATQTRAPVVRFSVPLPQGDTVRPSTASAVALSPDGTRLVYARLGNKPLMVRRIDELEPKPIDGTEGSYFPVFSPDDQSILFGQGQVLKKLSLSGGAPVSLGIQTMAGAGIGWGPDHTILYVADSQHGIYRVSANGGKLEVVTKVDREKGERTHRFPQWLPDGKHFLFTVSHSEGETFDDARIVVQSLSTGERKVLIEGGTDARYSPTGHLVYARGGTLHAAPFDLNRLALTGPPIPIAEGVFQSLVRGHAHFGLSNHGTLAYAAGPAIGAPRGVFWVDRQGKADPLPLPVRAWLHPRISPDGRLLAIEAEGANHDPVWTSDGKRVAFRSWRTSPEAPMSMWWMPVDRSAPDERLTSIGRSQAPVSWSPDGRFLAFNQMTPGTAFDVFVLSVDGDRKPRPVVETKSVEGSAKFSPDGKWLAFCSNESGRPEVFVQAYPSGPRIQISTDGGTDPVWARNGKELFYRNGNKMMVVDVTLQPFRPGKPRVLWEGEYAHGLSSSCGPAGPSSSNYDVTPDGKRFIMIKEQESPELVSTRVQVVLNWPAELKRLAQQKEKP
jgi:serine/threonine-protein kinase